MISAEDDNHVAYNQYLNQYNLRCFSFYARWLGNSCQHLAIIRQDINFSINSLWPSDATRRHKSGSTLDQVILNGLCLMAPSHYLNQVWKISIYDHSCISPGQWVKGISNTFAVQNRVPVWSIQIFVELLFLSHICDKNLYNMTSLYLLHNVQH